MTKPYRADGEAFEPSRPARGHDDTRRRRRSAPDSWPRLCAGRPARSRVVASGRARMCRPSPSRRRVVVALAGVGGFFASVDHPVRSTQTRWDDFKHLDSDASASSHFGPLGSNRYDFWRVAWTSSSITRRGDRRRGWDVAYLAHGAARRTGSARTRSSSTRSARRALIGVPARRTGAGVLALVPRRAGPQLARCSAGALGTGVVLRRSHRR